MIKGVLYMASFLMLGVAFLQQEAMAKDSTSSSEVDYKNIDLEWIIENRQLKPSEKFDQIKASLLKQEDPIMCETLLSVIRIQKDVPSEENYQQTREVFDEVNWLRSSNAAKDKLPELLSHLRKLLDIKTFIHLNASLMRKCIKLAKKAEQSSQMGAFLASGEYLTGIDLMLAGGIKNAEIVLAETDKLLETARSFKSVFKTKQEIQKKIEEANNFINGLYETRIKIDREEVKISRSIRRYVRDVTRATIKELERQLDQKNFQKE